MSTHPLLSVCIPAFNSAPTILETIRSVLTQDFKDLELLVVDDRSADDTAALVAAVADARVRYVCNPSTLGPQGNWNRCLELARGRYFKLLPHDDLLLPGALRRQVEVLEADALGEIAIVFCARRIIGPGGQTLIAARGVPGGHGGAYSRDRILRLSARHGTNVVGEPGGVMCRLALTSRAGPFDATFPYVIDFDYWVRLLAHGHGHYMPEPLVAFRVWPGSWSVALGGVQSRQFRQYMARTCSGLRLSSFDRLAGWVMPGLNNLARLAFYRFVLR